jgi:hypothetical protein
LGIPLEKFGREAAVSEAKTGLRSSPAGDVRRRVPRRVSHFAPGRTISVEFTFLQYLFLKRKNFRYGTFLPLIR